MRKPEPEIGEYNKLPYCTAKACNRCRTDVSGFMWCREDSSTQSVIDRGQFCELQMTLDYAELAESRKRILEME